MSSSRLSANCARTLSSKSPRLPTNRVTDQGLGGRAPQDPVSNPPAQRSALLLRRRTLARRLPLYPPRGRPSAGTWYERWKICADGVFAEIVVAGAVTILRALETTYKPPDVAWLA